MELVTHVEPPPPVADRGTAIRSVVDQMARPSIWDLGLVDVEPGAGMLLRRAQRGAVVLHLGHVGVGVPDVLGLETERCRIQKVLL